MLLVLAALVMYAGMRVLWVGAPGRGMLRGVALAIPIIGLAVYFASTGSSGMAIALLLSCSVFMTTLVIGAWAANSAIPDAADLSSLRWLAPLCLVTCLIGFHGELSLIDAGAVLVTAGLIAWSVAEGRSRATLKPAALAFASLPILVGGAWLIVVAAERFQSASGAGVVTPIVVLMIAPASLLALVGVAAKQGADAQIDRPIDTVVGFVIACLGFGQAIVIVTATLVAKFSTATTQPSSGPSSVVLMPVATWRVDSVLLVVLSILFFPVGTGRFKLGRFEGIALVVLYLIYARIAVRTGSLAG